MNVAKTVAALERLTVKELRQRFAEEFGETTAANNKTWLVRRIAWRLQAQAEGGLSERARQRAAELANDADLRVSPPKAKPAAEPPNTVTAPFRPDPRVPVAGTVITRTYKGRTCNVLVRVDGFEFEGQTYGSLTAVAKAITGQHCNGFHFFRLSKEAAQ